MIAPISPDENGNGKHWKSRLFDWLFSQGVSTVLLAAILFVLGYLGDYALRVAIPSHLRTIQDGYERAQSEHKAQQKELLERLKEDRQRDREWSSLERDKDRQEWGRLLDRAHKGS